MAEQNGMQSWRVRYRTAADNYAADIECDQRRNTWLDHTCGRSTVTEWVTTG